jgi:hypothetical protein
MFRAHLSSSLLQPGIDTVGPFEASVLGDSAFSAVVIIILFTSENFRRVLRHEE